MTLPGRTYSSTAYRYGFNGKEKDDEVKGGGLQYDYGFRIYDPRIGKFLSTDPLFAGYPYYTPYQFAGNRPIWAVDLDGLEELTKTSTRVWSIAYIVDSSGEPIEGTYTFYSNHDNQKMTVTSGVKKLKREGKEGGSIMVERRWYEKTDMGRKNGLRRYDINHIDYYDTGEYIAIDPNNHNKAIDDVEEVKDKPVTEKVDSESVSKKASESSKTGSKTGTGGSSSSSNVNTEEEIKKKSSKITKIEDLGKVYFHGNEASYKVDMTAEMTINQIASMLRENSENTAEIIVTTKYAPGHVIEDNWIMDDYTSDKLLDDRVAKVKESLSKQKGINIKKQIKIITEYNDKGKQHLRGSVIEIPKQ